MRSATTPRVKISEAIQSVAGPVSFKNRTLALFAIPSFSVVMFANPARLAGSLLEWFLIGCIAYAVTVMVLLLFKATVLPARPRKPNWWLTTLAFFAAGALRGYCVWLVGREWGIVPESDLLFRITSGFLLVLGGVGGLAIYEASRIRQAEQLAALHLQTAKLDELRGGIRERIRVSQQELVNKIRGILEPIVAQLLTDIARSDSTSALNTIREAVDQLIRPLSREMGSAGSNFEQSLVANALASTVKISKSVLPKRVFAGSMMVPSLALFATITTAPGPLALYIEGSALEAFLISILLIFASFQILKSATSKLSLPIWAALLVSLAPAFIGPLLIKITLDALGWVTPASSWYQFALVLFCTVILAFLMQLTRTQRAEHERNLRVVVHDLGVLNSQLRQEVWFNRRRTAAVLHGPIQASLYASAMRIKPGEKISQEMSATVERDIALALAKLDGSNMIEPFDSVLEQITEVWDGIAQISVVEQPLDLREALERNPTAAACALEIIREAVSNAIKHGSAGKITISLSLADTNFIALAIANDGLALSKQRVAGYGSQILDEVTYEWSLESLPTGVELKALVAIQK